jgi:hypothetical protein
VESFIFQARINVTSFCIPTLFEAGFVIERADQTFIKVVTFDNVYKAVVASLMQAMFLDEAAGDTKYNHCIIACSIALEWLNDLDSMQGANA